MADEPHAIERPRKLYDFAALSRREPNRQQPGDRLDAQFSNLIDAINALALNLEALRRPQAFRDLPEAFKRDLASFLTSHVDAAAADVHAALASALEIEPRVRSDVVEAVGPVYADLNALETRVNASLAALDGRLDAMRVDLLNLALSPVQTNDTVQNPALGPNAGGPYGADVTGATSTASDYAQVSIEWAEHMPDVIPPNILAINAITGDHWSSRWWANRAAAAMGGAMAWFYLGAYPSTNAPTHTPTGDPLEPGMIYYATDAHEMMVWNGLSWQPMGTPQPAFTTSLYYALTEGQTVVDISVNDFFAHNATIQTGQGVVVHISGVRLMPVNDYTVTLPSTITFTQGAPGGAFCTVDILILGNQLAPSAVAVKSLKPLVPAFDGSTTIFTLACTDGTTINVTNAVQLILSLDGVNQEPGVAFTAAGAQITFMSPPSADSYAFGLWLMPAS